MTRTSTSSAATPSVVVVGAGLAGLTAAWRLCQAGVEVSVLEARDRVGGRTWSQAWADGTVIERGGEFIAPDQDVLHGLVAELGLGLTPHGFSFDRRPTPEHEAPTREQLTEFVAWGARCARALDADASILDALSPADRRSAATTLALSRMETSMTVPLDRVSARLTFTGAMERYDPAQRVTGGNQRVATELARRLPGRIATATPVVAVENGPDRAVVYDRQRRRHEGDAVILALPLPILLDLDYVAGGIAPQVRAAAGGALFGDAAKLHIPLAHRPSPSGMASSAGRWWCWTSQASPADERGAPVLSCFAGGGAAIEQLSAEAALRLRPDVERRDGEEVLLTHWGADPWTRGSYSAPAVGARADDPAWTQPWESVIFAGEHTAGSLASTMNGAAASGARAAESTLRLLARS